MYLDKRDFLIAVVGPTASGKSELAVKIAKKIGGEIISADSRQVFQSLDIGTAKVRGKWLTKRRINKKSKVFIYKNIPHYCLDFVSIKKSFSAGEFKKCAEQYIKNILARKKTPIIVGGTGFWIDTLLYNIKLPEVPPDPKLRKSLEKKNATDLYRILKELDPARAKTIEKENPRRLIRAIEIAKKLGKVPMLEKKPAKYPVVWIGLNPPTKLLEKNILERAGKMINHGLLEETRQLLKDRVDRKKIRELGFEYKNALNYLDGNITKKEMLSKLIRDTLHYAKQQMRWFKRNKEIRWFTSPSLHPIEKELKTI
ncbi:MAG: tRNA (adenosine(37)-N6)-dimethylallyltransferase MiaA [bacterium]|nr:tRNA (adenosine(37)-N6)-dimethylallyltransferase MiaA [bacterium]